MWICTFNAQKHIHDSMFFHEVQKKIYIFFLEFKIGKLNRNIIIIMYSIYANEKKKMLIINNNL